MSKSLTVALCGGGTGGHVIPALAVGQELLRQRPDTKLIYIGVSGSLEERLATSAGIEFYPVKIKPLRRGVVLPNLPVPGLAAYSILRAMNLLQKQRIRIVFGSGGFSSWPACAAAKFNRTPFFLTDGNAYPGLVTRLLGSSASRVYIAFEETFNYFKGRKDKLRLTGFPVSKAFGNTDKIEARKKLGLDPNKKVILATGGSGGALSVNKTISLLRPEIINRNYSLIWQTGKQWDDESSFEIQNQQTIVERFLVPDRMALAISAADVAITRCGIMTLSELAVAGLPAILVPFPFSAENHQEANARAIEKSGGGVVILDKELSSETLLNSISFLLDPQNWKLFSEGMNKFAKPTAAADIVTDMLEIVHA